MKKSIVSSAVLLALAATPALAAETAEKYSASILGMEGNVLVNQDGSYKTATRGMNLQEGDRVMIMDGAKLSMSYPDGCHFTFKDGQIIEVGSVSVCAMGGTGFVAATTPQYARPMMMMQSVRQRPRAALAILRHYLLWQHLLQ